MLLDAAGEEEGSLASTHPVLLMEQPSSPLLARGGDAVGHGIRFSPGLAEEGASQGQELPCSSIRRSEGVPASALGSPRPISAHAACGPQEDFGMGAEEWHRRPTPVLPPQPDPPQEPHPLQHVSQHPPGVTPASLRTGIEAEVGGGHPFCTQLLHTRKLPIPQWGGG